MPNDIAITMEMEKELEAVYGHKVRVRACGLCWQRDSLLLIDHQYLGTPHFWAPPGGGIDFGESARGTLVREFKEETDLTVTIGKHLFTCEFIRPPLHSIELFFEVHVSDGLLKKGFDPETKLPVIGELTYVDFNFIRQLPITHRHGVFNVASSANELRKLHGYIQLL
jgi:8-oxo-dGTP diphosphatase